MNDPAFRTVATMSTGPTALADAIAATSMVQPDSPIRVRDVLDRWTDSEDFVELFRAARDGAHVDDHRFVDSLSRMPSLQATPDPRAAASEIIDVFLPTWHHQALSQARDKAPAAAEYDVSSFDEPEQGVDAWYSIVVTIVGVLGLIGSGLGLIGFAVGGASLVSMIATAGSGAFGAVGIGVLASGVVLCGVGMWLSWSLLERKPWARTVHVVLFAISAVIGGVTGLLALSAVDLLVAGVEAYVVWVLTRPSVIAEFENAQKTATG